MLIISSGRYNSEITSGSLSQNEKLMWGSLLRNKAFTHQQHMKHNSTQSGNLKGEVAPDPNVGNHGE